MGKKSKIRTGAGDIVTTPGALHKQIEKSTLAKSKFKSPKQFHKEAKDVKVCWKHKTLEISLQFVDPSLSSKILSEANKQWKEETAAEKEEILDDEVDQEEEDESLIDEEEFAEQQSRDLNEHRKVQQII